MNKSLLSIVACPLCKSSLHYAKEESLLICRAERLAFPVEGEQPLLLESAARSLSVEETDRLTRPKG
ncbi:MAG: Trm112 family protein [Gammaproteobacteria bacterium]